MSETSWPAKKSWKLRCLRARKRVDTMRKFPHLINRDYEQHSPCRDWSVPVNAELRRRSRASIEQAIANGGPYLDSRRWVRPPAPRSLARRIGRCGSLPLRTVPELERAKTAGRLRLPPATYDRYR